MRFIQNMLRSTLLHANKTTKKCIQFLNETDQICQKITDHDNTQGNKINTLKLK